MVAVRRFVWCRLSGFIALFCILFIDLIDDNGASSFSYFYCFSLPSAIATHSIKTISYLCQTVRGPEGEVIIIINIVIFVVLQFLLSSLLCFSLLILLLDHGIFVFVTARWHPDASANASNGGNKLQKLLLLLPIFPRKKERHKILFRRHRILV